MTDIIESGGRELATATTEDLRAELARGLTLTAEVLTRLGMIWMELERRGEDLSDLRHGLAQTLPLIATGRLAAEAVVAFAAKRSILRALEGIPLEQQRRLAAGEPVEIVVPGSPERTERVGVRAIPAQQLRFVFSEGEVLPPTEQWIRMARRRRPRQAEAEDGYRYRPRYDRDSGTVRVGRMAVRLEDLLSELSAAAGPDRPPPADMPDEYATAKTRLSHDEMRRLLDASRRAGLPEWEMIRKALRAFGLI